VGVGQSTLLAPGVGMGLAAPQQERVLMNARKKDFQFA